MACAVSNTKRKRHWGLSSYKKRVKKLSSLIEVSTLINSTLDLKRLLTIIMAVAEDVMDTEASCLMLLDKETKELVFQVALGKKSGPLKKGVRLKMGEGIAGWVAHHAEAVIVHDVRKDPRFCSHVDKATGFVTRSILCVPMLHKRKVLGVLQVLNPHSKKRFTEEDKELFTAFANQAAVAIENVRMHAKILEQQRLEQEISLASQIQQNFLPRTIPTVPGLSLRAKNVPARNVSGDFYSFIKFDNEKTGIIIGDVSGKGVPAALLMVEVMSEFRFYGSRSDNTSQVLKLLNNTLIEETTLGMFATALYLIVDLKKRCIAFSSAGHPSMLRLKKSSGEITHIVGKKGLPLGISRDTPYYQEVVPLDKGSQFFLYTDGLSETAEMKEGLSIEQFLKSCYRSSTPSLSNTFDRITSYFSNTPLHDDMTVVAFAREP